MTYGYQITTGTSSSILSSDDAVPVYLAQFDYYWSPVTPPTPQTYTFSTQGFTSLRAMCWFNLYNDTAIIGRGGAVIPPSVIPVNITLSYVGTTGTLVVSWGFNYGYSGYANNIVTVTVLGVK